jgi:hypothetical protein
LTATIQQQLIEKEKLAKLKGDDDVRRSLSNGKYFPLPIGLSLSPRHSNPADISRRRKAATDRLTLEWLGMGKAHSLRNNINWHTVYSTQKNYQKRLVAEYRNNTNMAGVNRLQLENRKTIAKEQDLKR